MKYHTQSLAHESHCDSSMAETITQQEKSVLILSIISRRATYVCEHQDQPH